MKHILSLILALFTATILCAQQPDPTLEHVMTLKVKIAEGYGVGKTPHGNRFVIPITGGTFEGPAIKGEILSGGADYQMQNTEYNRTELEAIYCIRTDDGVTIHVRNSGVIATTPEYYFFTSPHFEAPLDGKYAWLNNGIYVCRPDHFGEGEIWLKVWKVK